jgi:hypothetical protein
VHLQNELFKLFLHGVSRGGLRYPRKEINAAALVMILYRWAPRMCTILSLPVQMPDLSEVTVGPPKEEVATG